MAESAVRHVRKLAALVKLTSAGYGSDPVPTGMANAIQFTNVNFRPLEGQQVSRELLLPHLGHQGVILTGNYSVLEGDVELAGAGAAGGVPGYGVLLRACGMHETVTVDTEVVYNPISGSFEDAGIYFNLDGVRHVMLGVRGTFSLSLAPQQIPRIRFTMTGLIGTITDTALPAVTLTAFQKPLPISKANTTVSLHGYAGPMESLELQLGGTVEPRLLINEESIKITDREATGTAVVQAATLATKNWFAIAQAHTLGALAVVHGTAAGNIVAIDADYAQIGRPTQGQSQGIANYSLPLMLTPSSAGNDEMILTVK
jgi:hypothetical protein